MPDLTSPGGDLDPIERAITVAHTSMSSRV